MKVAIRQIRGGSGADVWADNLCRGLRQAGQECSVHLASPVYQMVPSLAGLSLPSPECDIVHGNSWNGFAFRDRCPLVVTEHLVVHDPDLSPYKSLAQKLYHRWIFRCEKKSFDTADAVVSVSRYTQQKVEEIFGLADTTMIHNGVDSSFFSPEKTDRASWGLPEDKCILLYTGNLTRRKGADLLPSIMKQLGDRFLLLTTSGNRNMSRDNIPFSRDIGYVNPEQLVQAYSLCDIFIIPSRMEGLSLSTLEAMSCGKPVVAFNCTSFSELIAEGQGGFLCEKDNVNEYADRIRYLAEVPEMIRNMGAFNRRRIQQGFTLERMTGEYLRLYRSLLE